MLKDRHGKEIVVGSTVKLADGTTAKVSGIVGTRAQVSRASDVEVVPVNTHSKASDGDAIIWGT